MKPLIKTFRTPFLMKYDSALDNALNELDNSINDFANNHKILKYTTNVIGQQYGMMYIVTILYEE